MIPTPGPWQVTHLRRGIDHVNAFSIAGPARGEDTCHEIARTCDETLAANPANAALLGAAPLLLAALREIRAALEHAQKHYGCTSEHCSGTCHFCANIRRASAAIAVAERSPHA